MFLNKCPDCYEELDNSKGVSGKVDGERIVRFTCPVCGCKFEDHYGIDEHDYSYFEHTKKVRSGTKGIVREIAIIDSYNYVEECEGFSGSLRLVWKCTDAEGRPIKQVLHCPGHDEYPTKRGEPDPVLPPATLTTYTIGE